MDALYRFGFHRRLCVVCFRDETLVCSCFLGLDITVDLVLVNAYARSHFSLGNNCGWVDARATFGPDVTSHFRWVYVDRAQFGDRMMDMLSKVDCCR